MKYQNIEIALNEFIKELKVDKIYRLLPTKQPNAENYEYNIYNEISLQHELGKFLKEKLGGYWNVFFEKNIYDDKKKEYKKGHYWVKKEIDLIAIKYKDKNQKDISEKYAIELKFKKGKNARTPENMFDFLRDIRFMEQCKEYIKDMKFNKTFVLIIVDAEKYYYNKNECKNERTKEIYDIFRIDQPKENKNDNNIEFEIPGKRFYKHPTGKTNEKIYNNKEEDRDYFKLASTYRASWITLKDSYKYIFIETELPKNNIKMKED